MSHSRWAKPRWPPTARTRLKWRGFFVCLAETIFSFPSAICWAIFLLVVDFWPWFGLVAAPLLYSNYNRLSVRLIVIWANSVRAQNLAIQYKTSTTCYRFILVFSLCLVTSIDMHIYIILNHIALGKGYRLTLAFRVRQVAARYGSTLIHSHHYFIIYVYSFRCVFVLCWRGQPLQGPRLACAR
jgi:hypothetical protein